MKRLVLRCAATKVLQYTYNSEGAKKLEVNFFHVRKYSNKNLSIIQTAVLLWTKWFCFLTCEHLALYNTCFE